MAKIRVLIVDDHAIVRAGLRMLINPQPDMEVVGEAADGQEALCQARAANPDVLTLDLTMPGGGGLKIQDRKSTRLNSSHRTISYAVFCLKKKKKKKQTPKKQ